MFFEKKNPSGLKNYILRPKKSDSSSKKNVYIQSLRAIGLNLSQNTSIDIFQLQGFSLKGPCQGVVTQVAVFCREKYIDL